jgi:hypothetical protein
MKRLYTRLSLIKMMFIIQSRRKCNRRSHGIAMAAPAFIMGKCDFIDLCINSIGEIFI